MSSEPIRSTIQEEEVFQRIVYSQCWEDPTIAIEGLRLGPEDDLVCLTSAGCNVMALSLARPRSITTLDFSPSQNALLELKIAALRALKWSEYVAFLGARPSKNRVEVYRNKVRAELRDDPRRYFDENEGLLAKGVIHTGRFQRYLRIFRTTVLPLVHSKSTVETIMGIEDRDERTSYYWRHWENRRWRALFQFFFGKAVMARLGRDPSFFKYVDKANIGGEFMRRARWALTETNPVKNHFMQYALLGNYPDLERGPIYLREENFEALRESTASMRILRSDLESYLGTCAPNSVSALYLSDLFEWVSEEHHEAMLRAIASVTRPDGRFVYWNLLVPRSRPKHLANMIAVHDEEAEALHLRDQAFVYGSFHVESVRAN